MEESVFGSRYRVTEQIGTGGMADVFKAVDETLGRTVAVKVMHARFAADPSFAARFRQEAQAAAGLVSPNIVNIYDWGQDAGTYYIVMEYVRGSDLASIIEQEGALPSRRVAEIGAQVCSALSVAHGYDVIHRDIKPHNIMVQPDGHVKVMDFGIARAGTSMMTQTGSVLGTAHYLSPEQAQGMPLTAASDLYSLGVSLYQAATGVLPFEGATPVAVALKQVNEHAVPPRVANPEIDPGLEAVIVKAMAKTATERYSSAEQLRRDLVAVAQGAAAPRASGTAVMPRVGGSQTAAPAAHREPRTVPRRRPVWPWLAAAALIVVAGLGAALGASVLGDRPAPVPDVRSMTRADAQAALRKAGFTVGTVKVAFSDSVRAGAIVSQSTPPNATAPSGSTIDLVLSRGPEMVPVPDVVGMPEADAFKALEAAGFIPQALPSQFNADVVATIVYEQTPVGDEKAAKGSVVGYVVSRGAEPLPPDTGNWSRKPGNGKNRDNHE